MVLGWALLLVTVKVTHLVSCDGMRPVTPPLLPPKLMIWDEGEMTLMEHARSEWCNNGIRLDVEIPKHLIGSPTAKQPYGIGVDAGTKEGHGTGGPQRAH